MRLECFCCLAACRGQIMPWTASPLRWLQSLAICAECQVGRKLRRFTAAVPAVACAFNSKHCRHDRFGTIRPTDLSSAQRTLPARNIAKPSTKRPAPIRSETERGATDQAGHRHLRLSMSGGSPLFDLLIWIVVFAGAGYIMRAPTMPPIVCRRFPAGVLAGRDLSTKWND